MFTACASAALAADPVSVPLQFERQGLMLNTGEIIDQLPVALEPNGADLFFSYHADRTPRAVLVTASGAEMALVPRTDDFFLVPTLVSCQTLTFSAMWRQGICGLLYPKRGTIH